MNKVKAEKIISILSGVFPNKPALNFNSPYELLVAVILSAQCTDERVNKVTKELFLKANTPKKMIKLSVKELSNYIFSCGLYKTKAEHILSASFDIENKFNGQVPNNIKDLMSLSGVGRKTANVVYAVAFNGNAIAVDTHVFRVSNRIGFVKEKDVLKTERGLMKIINENEWSKSHHYLIYLGRNYCKARNPLCETCPINDLCEKHL